MSFVKENWQTTKQTIRERSTFMFNNDLLSDIKFVVRGSNGKSESKKVIPAHKFVLSISSPVFLAMFYGELADSKDSVDLPDCEYEGLLELFRYMYSDEVKLSGSNVMQVLYLAKKYMVPLLADECTEYLQKNLDASNVFCVLPNAEKYEEKNLVDRCWEVIDEQTEEAVKSDDFVTIERSLIEAVVERDSLIIKEVELFKAVDLWATKECGRQGLDVDGEMKRSILGEQIVKGIRFPVMKEKEFAGAVLDSDILNRNEVYGIIKYFNSLEACPVGFNASRREGGREQVLNRFCSTPVNQWNYSGKTLDRIVLSVDKDILLYGLNLFGSKNNSYSLTLDIKSLNSGLVLSSKSGKFESVFVESKSGNYYGFNIMFDSPVALQKGIKYCVEATISGPQSCYGQNGFSSVQCSGVTFNFETSSLPNNGTNTDKGQFPKFVFSLK